MRWHSPDGCSAPAVHATTLRVLLLLLVLPVLLLHLLLAWVIVPIVLLALLLLVLQMCLRQAAVRCEQQGHTIGSRPVCRSARCAIGQGLLVLLCGVKVPEPERPF